MNDILPGRSKIILKVTLDYSVYLRLKCAEKLYGVNPQALAKLAIGDWLEGNDIPLVTQEDIQGIENDIT